MMQDIILARVWADHHQRVYGDGGQPPEIATGAAVRAERDSLPTVGKAMVLALAASLASLGSSLATVAVA